MSARLLLLFSSVLILAGCAIQRIPFNESEYTISPNSGDKIVTGKMFLIDQLGQTQFGSNCEVILEPATSYSNQWFEVSYLNNLSLTAPDPRYVRYVQKTKADKNGVFTFEKVAPGEYYLSGMLKWRAATCSGNMVYKAIPISQRISVASGDTKIEAILTKPFTSPSDICNTYNQGDWVKE